MSVNGKWNTVPIKELYHGLYDGPHATPKPSDEGPVFLGIKNVTDDGRLDLNDIRHINESEYPRWTKRVVPSPGDIVFTYEATLNRYAIVPDGFRGCLGRRIALIRPDERKVDTRFLHYYFFSQQWRDVIRNNMLTGATVDRIPLTTFPEFPVTLPDLPTQRRIAGILSAYDDLIENNLRRIRILEEMAQSLYREWFVHFRFPGHESVPLVDSPLGPIPDRWEVSEIGSLTTKVGSGATPRGGKESYKAEGIPLVRSMNIYDYNFEFDDLAFIDSQQADQLSNVAVESVDVLLNITGASVCRCAMIPSYLVPARVNQHVAIIRANPDLMDAHFLLDSINSDENKRRLFNLAQGGATREALTKDAICRFEIVVPPLPLVRRYGRIGEALHSQRESLQSRNQALRQTRDLLLPKLLSPSS